MKKRFALTLTAAWLFSIAALPVVAATTIEMPSVSVDAEASPTESVLVLNLNEFRSADGTIDVEAVKDSVAAACSEMVECTVADIIWAALKIIEECGDSGGEVWIQCTEDKVEMISDILCYA